MNRSQNDVRDHPHHGAEDSIWRVFSADFFDEQEPRLHAEPVAPEFLSRRARPRGRDRDSFAGLPDARGWSSASRPSLWFVRIGVPLAAILISWGFFFSVLPPTATQASRAVALIYLGAVVLAILVVTLGVGLLRSPPS